MNDDLSYPIGRFEPPAEPSAADVSRWIHELDTAPRNLRAAVDGLTADQLDTPYRPGGWTVRQLVHHVPDSHMNGYVRTCLALTEQEPTIRPYDEQAWAELTFARTGPIEVSLDLLDAVHARWVPLLRGVTEAQLQRAFVHPVNGRTLLVTHIAHYAWHGRHHVAHVTSLRERAGW